MAKTKMIMNKNVNESVKGWEPSNIAGENDKWCSWKTVQQFFKKLNIELLNDPAILLTGIQP